MSAICIPRVDANLEIGYIKETLNKLNIGYVKKIREIPLKNDSNYKRILLRFKWKENNVQSIHLQKQMEELGSLKVVHNMPWYWKLVVAQ
jgi:hypothetical protein